VSTQLFQQEDIGLVSIHQLAVMSPSLGLLSFQRFWQELQPVWLYIPVVMAEAA
jgi:hypothetical protein